MPPAEVAAEAPADARTHAQPLNPDALAALLHPLWKRLRRGARAIAAADPEALHGLRKRAKRLRYVLEALAPLLPRKATVRLLAALRRALERLGEINDLHTAEQSLRALASPSPSAWFALGLVGERRRALLPAAQRALDRVFERPPPWR
jgi:CHAD domain-containing protein